MGINISNTVDSYFDQDEWNDWVDSLDVEDDYDDEFYERYYALIDPHWDDDDYGDWSNEQY